MTDFEKCKYQESCGYDICIPEFCHEYEAVPITNGDYIRSMSDKELIEFVGHASLCNRIQRDGTFCDEHAVCENCLREWIKQPWKEEEE